VFPLNVQNYPPLCMCWKLLFIGKNVVRSPNLVPQLFSFFVNLIFLIFWIFLININSKEENY
jgi:energy-converting hydrogenase Eha subunit F